jgi:hypothetical protein
MFIRSSAEKRRIKLDELIESQGYDSLLISRSKNSVPAPGWVMIMHRTSGYQRRLILPGRLRIPRRRLRSPVRNGLFAGGNRIRTIGPSLEQIVCLASRTVAIGEKIREPDGRKAFAESC